MKLTLDNMREESSCLTMMLGALMEQWANYLTSGTRYPDELSKRLNLGLEICNFLIDAPALLVGDVDASALTAENRSVLELFSRIHDKANEETMEMIFGEVKGVKKLIIRLLHCEMLTESEIRRILAFFNLLYSALA